MTQVQFSALLPIICIDLIEMIAQKNSITDLEATVNLYQSRLYSSLEKESTKLWHYSTPMLYALDKIISLMNLGEKHLIVLNGRLRGDTYAQLAAVLHCTTAGVQGFRLVTKNVISKSYEVMRTSCTI